MTGFGCLLAVAASPTYTSFQQTISHSPTDGHFNPLMHKVAKMVT